jgi:CheY-like chemotaxis protein
MGSAGSSGAGQGSGPGTGGAGSGIGGGAGVSAAGAVIASILRMVGLARVPAPPPAQTVSLRRGIAARRPVCIAARGRAIVDDRPVAPARVLIVDDDPDIRALVTYVLTVSGHDVICAEDGEAGLAAAREHAPDLVLADWTMPRLTGAELCARLRADPATAGIPVVLLTARTDDAALRGGREAGADEYVSKPFSPRELAARVDEILSRGA